MAISVGDTLPDATLVRMGDNGPEQVTMSTLTAGRKVVIFGLPGAFTGTCTTAHVPSFIRTKAEFDAKGVDAIICLSVNDVFVMDTWGKTTGAAEAGIVMLGDPETEFTRAIGMEFSVPAVGLINRSMRYALYAEDGVVKVLNDGDAPGTCEIAGGEAMLASI